jgi:hypothetical protein
MRIRLAALFALAGACHSPSTIYTEGEQGRAQFGWNAGVGCAIAQGFASSGYHVTAEGCDASAPMATRAIADLQVVNASSLPAFQAATSDGSIVEAAASGSAIRLTSRRAGRVELTLTDGSGATIDRLAITISDVAAIALADPSSVRSRYLIEVGGSDNINLALKDAAGKSLVGVGAVDYALTGGLGAQQVTLGGALADAVVGSLFGTSEHASVDAVAAGAGALSVTAPSGAALDLPAEVVDASAVAMVTVSERAPLQAGSAVIFDAVAAAGDGEHVHSASCNWSVTPAGGPIAIDWQLRDTVQLKASAAASATLACVVGGASGNLSVAAH